MTVLDHSIAVGHGVVVWAADLADVRWQDARWRTVLSDAEVRRARRFHAPLWGRRYEAAHSALRGVLARYYQRAPSDLQFLETGDGKPRCGSESGAIEFNMSHSQDHCVVAVSPVAVGIDIECHRAVSDLSGIASRYFSSGEASRILSAPPIERAALFFRCWTRKEAYLKSIGAGLRVPLDSFDVAPNEAGPIRLTTPSGAACTIVDVPLGAGVSCSVAVEGRQRPVTVESFHA